MFFKHVYTQGQGVPTEFWGPYWDTRLMEYGPHWAIQVIFDHLGHYGPFWATLGHFWSFRPKNLVSQHGPQNYVNNFFLLHPVYSMNFILYRYLLVYSVVLGLVLEEMVASVGRPKSWLKGVWIILQMFIIIILFVGIKIGVSFSGTLISTVGALVVITVYGLSSPFIQSHILLSSSTVNSVNSVSSV